MQLNLAVKIPMAEINMMTERMELADLSLKALVTIYIQEVLYDEAGMGGEFRVASIQWADPDFRVDLIMRFPYSYWAAAGNCVNLLDPLEVCQLPTSDLMAPAYFGPGEG